MENDKPLENFWMAESALTRKVGTGALVAAWGFAMSGRAKSATKVAAFAGGAFVLAEVERRLGKKNEL